MEAITFTNMVVLPKKSWEQVEHTLQEITSELQKLKEGQQSTTIIPGYISAQKFMDAVNIGRSLFDELVAAGKIKTLKKHRKVYVSATEVQRYFDDPNI